MDQARRSAQGELTALAICPNRELSQAFAATLPQTRAFHILGELKAYPPPSALDIRLRQLRPDVVLVDLATDLGAATQVIEYIASLRPPVFVIGLHAINDSEAILQSLRAGATEFLYYPFDIDVQREAIGRILRLRQPTTKVDAHRGKLVAFTSSKPGSGSSTLASQVAHSLRKNNNTRVLLADFDQWSGTVGFYFKVSHWSSLPDALRLIGERDADWASMVVSADGIDVLPAPDAPKGEKVDANRLHDLLEYVRALYDYVLIDLPVVFDPLSLMTLSNADEAFLVTTAEMPALHLTRRAVQFLMAEAGIGQERFRVVVNRMDRDSIAGEELAKIFGAPVFKTLPNDYLSLHKAMTVGQPLGGKSALGRLIEEIATHVAKQEARRA